MTSPADDSCCWDPDAEYADGAVVHSAKLIRIGSMIKQVLEELRTAEVDQAARERLHAFHDGASRELGHALAPTLREELERLALSFDGGMPSEVELRLAHAQMVGWLEGLLHGIQTALTSDHPHDMHIGADAPTIGSRATDVDHATSAGPYL